MQNSISQCDDTKLTTILTCLEPYEPIIGGEELNVLVIGLGQ